MVEGAIITDSLQRDFQSVVAVDDLTLHVPAGEVYGFLGPNGAGKTTVVRILSTLLKPTGGRASVAGFDIIANPDDVRRRIGVALQEAALDGKQSGIELMLLQARLFGLSSRSATRRVAETVDLFGLGGVIRKRVATYSGGMKRRLDLALALIAAPHVLFLDEPTTGLDVASRAAVWREVRRVNVEQGVTVFLTTQYLEEADHLASRVGIINHGRLVAEGTPKDLKRSFAEDFIFAELELGSEEDHDLIRSILLSIAGIKHVEVASGRLRISSGDAFSLMSPVAVALNRSGIRVRNLSVRPASLDDVFLALTTHDLRQEVAG